MLNKKGIRELAYVVEVDDIKPIEGADRVEQAIVGGWHIMVKKDTFKPGDLAIYFEIDSKVPEKEPFMFLSNKDFKIKTQKYFKGTVISQGLLMSFEDFGWAKDKYKKGDFLTDILEVKYSVQEDNERKAPNEDKYKKMAQRNKKVFSNPIIRKIMKYNLGRKIMFLFFGKKSDSKKKWLDWVVKTDEERVQNMTWILGDKSPWIATEKIDGTSCTFTMRRGAKKIFRSSLNEFYVCSRNVVFEKEDQECFYDTNFYWEMAKKYNVEDVLTSLLENDFPDAKWVTIQGEIYGAGVQKRNYSMSERDFAGFNLVTSTTGRLNSKKAKMIATKYEIPWVPILSENYILPDTVEELLDAATAPSVIDGELREGLVFRSLDGLRSFKAVSNEFLMKFH